MSDEDTTTDDQVEETETVEETTSTTDAERDKAFAEQRRKTRAAEKKAKDLEAKLAAKERSEKESEGRYQEIAEEERKAREALEQQVADRDRRDAVVTAATRLKFKNPTLAHRLLADEDITDERSAEQALKRLAENEPYLIQDAPSRTGLPASGADPGTGSEDPLVRAGAGLLATINAKRAGR